MQHFLSGKTFDSIAEVRQFLADYFSSKATEFCRRGIYNLLARWQNVIDVKGDYFVD